MSVYRPPTMPCPGCGRAGLLEDVDGPLDETQTHGTAYVTCLSDPEQCLLAGVTVAVAVGWPLTLAEPSGP